MMQEHQEIYWVWKAVPAFAFPTERRIYYKQISVRVTIQTWGSVFADATTFFLLLGTEDL